MKLNEFPDSSKAVIKAIEYAKKERIYFYHALNKSVSGCDQKVRVQRTSYGTEGLYSRHIISIL